MPKITICVPQWQVLEYIQPCLRSIRKHSAGEDVEVLVIDNGSKDESLDYLRSLSWIRLIERPEEVHTNWPTNVFTAWDRGLTEATGEYYVTMHSDVFVKADGWLRPLVRELERSPEVAASGTWKLEIENPFYAAQKRAVGLISAGLKRLVGQQRPVGIRQGHYPRDFCAMYRRDILREHELTFQCLFGNRGGGYSISRQLWERGYKMGLVPVREMARHIEHVAHGTAAVRGEKRLGHARTQRKAETKVADLFAEPWIQALMTDASLDGPRKRAA
ncbi:MAG: glycosyltransferase [Planctomycetota bacterium]|nr:glycosyltransferase family 2 protein [Planctomycetaceae bacterium]MDQ3330868.1 glycosyltransferase [Planctomycetota bacterium]